MAFRFFRRRQKMVVIVMAVLMVTFLIGFQGFRMLFEPSRSKGIVGTISKGQIKIDDLRVAESDLELLRWSLGLGYPPRMMQQAWPTDAEFLAINTNEHAELAYALLLREARSTDVIVTEADVDAFFRATGNPAGSENYKAIIANIKTSPTLAERHLRGAVANWLRIIKIYSAGTPDVLPSEQELRLLYRDVKETINLLAARISAERFIDEISPPTREEILEQFNRYKTVDPGAYPTVASFGFGYRQPDRVAIQYLFISQNVVDRVTAPSDKAVRQYFRDNRNEFVREISPATQPVIPGSDAATKPAAQSATTQPKESHTVAMQFSQAKPQIIAKLKPRAVENKLEEVLSRAESLVRAYGQSDVTDVPIHQWVADRMTRSADEPLGRTIPVVEIHQERLDRAMEKLGSLAKLQAICYPFGKTEAGELDPAVKVTLSARDIKLSEALKKISEQVRWPELNWAMCDGFEGVIFPVAQQTDLFPIKVHQTELMDIQQLQSEDIIPNSFTPAGQPLLQIVFQANVFEQNRTSLIKVGDDGPRMIVLGSDPGRLLWRLAEAVGAHAPDVLTADLQTQLISDIKLQKAFTRSIALARQVLEASHKDGLEEAAKSHKIEALNIGPIARTIQFNPQQQLLFVAMQRQMGGPDVLTRVLLERPVGFAWTNIPEISLPTAQLREHFMKAAFSLVPKDVEPMAGDIPYPKKPYQLTITELPALKEVLVLQRTGFRPVVQSEYEEPGRMQLFGALSARSRWEMRTRWFALGEIKKRLKFKESQN